MNQQHIRALIDGVAPVIKQMVKDAQSPLLDRIAELEKRAALKGDKGDPGKSVTVDDVRPVLEEMVAALPKAEPGKDADPEVTARLVADEVAKAVAALPAPEPGKSVTVDDVRPVFEEMVAALPKPEPGKDADPEVTARLVADEVAKAVAALPALEPGKSVTVDDVRPVLEEMVAALPKAEPGKDGVGLAGAVIDRDGNLVVTMTDGSPHKLGRVVGKDAEPAKPGEPGLGFDDLTLDYDGERTIKIGYVRGDLRKDLGTVVLPLMIYRGVWPEGKEFKAGDVVTFGGSLFVARKDTTTKPETLDCDWQLAAKRGRDGKNADKVDVRSIETQVIDVSKRYIDERFDRLPRAAR